MKFLSIFLFIFISILITQITCLGFDFDAYNSLQYEENNIKLGNHPYKHAVNLLGSTYHEDKDIIYHRHVVLMQPEEILERNERFNEKNSELLIEIADNEEITEEEIIESQNKLFQETITENAGGFIVILPEETLEEIEEWSDFESNLLQYKLEVPLYFVNYNSTLDSIYNSLKLHPASSRPSSFNPIDVINWATSDNFHFVVTPPSTPKAISEIELTNLQGWLSSRTDRTIVITTNIDCFGVSPGLCTGINKSGGDTITMLELLRLYSVLSNYPKGKSNYNILFLLTTGSREQNWIGAQEWLDGIDDRLKNGIDFVLCLDSIGSVSDDLFLHVSRPRDKYHLTDKLYNSFEITADQLGFNEFEVKHKKIKRNQDRQDWPHEIFAFNTLFSVTLSQHSDVPLVSSTTLDQIASNDLDHLTKKIQFIAESLAKYIFSNDPDEENEENTIDYKDIMVFSDDLSINNQFLESWRDAIISSNTFLPYFDQNLISGIEQFFDEFTDESTKKTFTLGESNVFYTEFTDNIVLNAFIVKPFVFDVIFALLSLSYIGLLHFLVKYFLFK